MQYSPRQELQAKAAAHRKKGASFGKIAEMMGITRGHAWSLLADRVPALPPPTPTESTVVKRSTHNGGCSTLCRDMYIAMPRITLLDGPFIGAPASAGTATVH
ncbi:hypothetical protein DKP76_07305 [Falsochrobactrum shanghaiense]|uniref:Uncharacterized protein n=1 Tax=Falsochrobactrum shanghaiense TaxID=2201899 RepID=A0A316JC92_9HYPH|nr:hypothetical protein DKP76_07305 [Falsochrobactrum shanghaiense]